MKTETSKFDFPHPVLQFGREDYNGECQFDFNVKMEDRGFSGEWLFIIDYTLVSPGFDKLIENGDAAIVLRVQSTGAFTREVKFFEKGTPRLSLSLRKCDYAGNIRFCVYILAAKDIPSFCLDEQNFDIFSGHAFQIRHGDILARSKTIEWKLEDEDIYGPIPSIFTIQKSGKKKTETHFDSDKIYIHLPDESYKLYERLIKNTVFKRLLSALIILPVLVEALEKLKYDEQGEFEGKRWALCLKRKIKEFGCDLENMESATSLAIELLGGISLDAMLDVHNFVKSISNE